MKSVSRQKLSRGDLVILPFPFTDLSTTKVRPAVILSSARYRPQERDIIVTLVSSNVSGLRQETDYLLRDWESEGLHAPSLVKISLSTVQASLVRRRIGKLTARDLAEVERRVKLALDL